MRLALALVLAASLLAGCAGAGGGHYAAGVIGTAEYALPMDAERLEEVASALGWSVAKRTVFEGGFSIDLADANGTRLTAQKHPQGQNWTLTHIFELPRDGPRYATAAEAVAAADAAWPALEDDFERIVGPFEARGQWERLRVRHACLCAEE